MITKKIKCVSVLLTCFLCACSDYNRAEIPQETVSPTPASNAANDPVLSASEIADADFSGIDNTSCGWGLKKIKGEAPEIPEKYKNLLKKYNAFHMGDTAEKAVYLTFDEGYENGYTAQILDTLKKYEVPAAFFVTGAYLEKEEALIKRMLDEGHIVGNHTVNHPNLPKLVGAEAMTKELCSLNEKFASMYGGAQMTYMRPPEGEYSERLLAVADAIGYKTIFWSFAYKDWDPSVVNGAEYAFEQITPYLHSGAILLLHAVSKDNADALGDVIDYARSNGYTFKSLDELPEIREQRFKS